MRLPATCADMATVMEKCNKALGLRKGAPPAQRILTMEGTEVVSEAEISHGQSLYYSFAAAPAAAAAAAPHTSKRHVSQVCACSTMEPHASPPGGLPSAFNRA